MSCCAFQAVPVQTAAPDPTKHVNYVTGMVLGVDDFTQEFAYLSARDRWLAREALGYGTLKGLAVRWRTSASGALEPMLVVTAGVALTPCGHLVCVPRDQCADINLWLDNDDIDKAVSARFAANATAGALALHVTLAYQACPTDDAPVPGEPCRSATDLMQPSRVQDGFALALSFDAPAQDEEQALQAFVKWFSDIPTAPAPNPSTPMADFRRALRAWTAQAPATAGLTLSRADVPAYRRAALHLWATELRPQQQVLAARRRFDAWLAAAPAAPAGPAAPATRDEFLSVVRRWTPLTTAWPAGPGFDAAQLPAYRAEGATLWPDIAAKWFGNVCGCSGAASGDDSPDLLLLAKISFSVERALGNRWRVVMPGPASAVAPPSVDDAGRALLMSLRLLQEWLARLDDAPAAPPPPAPALGLQAAVVAAGHVAVSGGTVAPVLGGLAVVPAELADGLITFSFDGYTVPGPDTGLVVKVLSGVLRAAGVAVANQPTVRFDAFQPQGFVLRVSRASKLVPVSELKAMHFQIEVTRISAAA